MTPTKLLYVVNDAAFFVSHRLSLGVAAAEAGYDVHVATPSGPGVADIRANGFTHHEIPLSRSSRRLSRELASVYALYRLYRALRPSIVHHVTIKPVLYGGLAARLARVPATVSAVSGLGFVFLAEGLRADMLRWCAMMAYRVAFSHPNTCVIFQNEDDRRVVVGRRSGVKTVLIHGSGVDLNDFRPSPEPAGIPVVVVPSRLLWDKGIGEFVAAARILGEAGRRVRLALVGALDPGNPAAVTLAEVESWQAEGAIEWWGYRKDMAQVFREATLVAFPSYREGLPRALIEAAASGRAVVTTDAPGCREVVRHGVNGLLVPVRDADALATAIADLLDDPDARSRFAQSGRAIAEAEFGVATAQAATLEVYQELLLSGRLRP